ncbi:MAG: hypothetical protein BWY57_01316 [Betaproteobacteria bacterium ADurb.Bin341]|nr:MAG: hypothetical protein BWY57_01316 [Betaproteobacteria bacterium ADurb.Bin341]
MTDKNMVTSPCGLDCFNCELFEANLTDEFAEKVHAKLGIPKNEVACKGCRQQDGKHFHLPAEGCATLDCVKARGVAFCYDCADFPCAFLAPTADKAAQYPHNMKVYNLCRIKRVGLDRWIEEEAGSIRKNYFTGKFVVGKGQAG